MKNRSCRRRVFRDRCGSRVMRIGMSERVGGSPRERISRGRWNVDMEYVFVWVHAGVLCSYLSGCMYAEIPLRSLGRLLERNVLWMINRGICHIAHTVVLSKALLIWLSYPYIHSRPLWPPLILFPSGDRPRSILGGQGVVRGIGMDRSERTGGTVHRFGPVAVEYTAG